MTDREMIIKGLECCQVIGIDLSSCDQCPYNSISINVADCRGVLCKDTLELLNEHRCKSCLYCELSDDHKWCLLHNVSPYRCRHLHMIELDLNWFCADWTARPESKRNATGLDEGCSADSGLMPAT